MDARGSVHVSLLDGFSIQAGGDAQEFPRGVQRLVAHLGLHGRRSRDALAGRLWPDTDEQRAHARLRSTLWRLQRLQPGLVEASTASLALAPGVTVDVQEFLDWTASVLDPGSAGMAAQLPALDGELLPGWYDDWVLLERERLRLLRTRAVEVLAERLLTAGRYGEAIETAFAAVRAEPLRESAHRVLVRAHLAEGNVAEAVREFETFRDLVLSELDVEPTLAMRELLDRTRPGFNPGPVRAASSPAR